MIRSSTTTAELATNHGEGVHPNPAPATPRGNTGPNTETRRFPPVVATALSPLTALFVLTFFIPDRIDFELGPLQITPQRAVGMVLMPMLLLKERIRWALPDFLATLYFFTGFISFTVSSGMDRAAEVTGRLSLDVLLPYLIARWIAQDAGRFKSLVQMMFTCLSAAAVLALIESLLGVNVWLEMWSLVENVGNTTHPESRLGLGRAKVWTDHPIMLGLVFAAWLPLALTALNDRWLRPSKFPAAAVGLFVAAIFLSLSSAAWIAGVMVIGLFLWERFAGHRPTAKWQVAWVGLPTLYWVLETLSGRPLLRLLMMKLHISSGNAWQYRWRLIRRVKEAMPGHQWLGHGLQRPVGFDAGFASSVDNHFMLVLLQRGRIGLWIWVAWMLAVCLFAAKAVWFGQDSPPARWTRAVCFGVIALALSQFSVALFSAGGRTFWFMSGLAVGLAVLTRRLNAKPQTGRGNRPETPHAFRPASNVQP